MQDYLAADIATNEFNTLLANPTISFKPSHYPYKQKILNKNKQLTLLAKDILPTLLLNDKLRSKITLHHSHNANKSAFALTNTVSPNITIQCDLLSYDINEGFTKYCYAYEYLVSKLQSDEMYSILFLFNNDGIAPSAIVSTLYGHLISNNPHYYQNNLDLLYLTQFRIAVVVEEAKKVNAFVYFPTLDFELQQIKQPNKLVDTPLTRIITRSSSSKQKKLHFKFGFLTIDQSNRILPLMAQDPIVHQLPLIGVWVYTNDPEHNFLSSSKHLLWGLLTEFVIAKMSAKISQDSAFLFTLFQNGSFFFDVNLTGQ